MEGKYLVFCSSELLCVKPHKRVISAYSWLLYFLIKWTKKGQSLYVVTLKYYITKLAVDFLQIAALCQSCRLMKGQAAERILLALFDALGLGHKILNTSKQPIAVLRNLNQLSTQIAQQQMAEAALAAGTGSGGRRGAGGFLAPVLLRILSRGPQRTR